MLYFEFGMFEHKMTHRDYIAIHITRNHRQMQIVY